MENELTILLLLKGRDDFTIRWFEHAKSHSLPYRVLVADGGEDRGIEQELIRRQYSEHIDYQYIKYPYDKNLDIYYKKTLDALTRVESEYVLFASNDDFYFFDELALSVDYLNTKPSYVAARGEIWDFSILRRQDMASQKDYAEHLYGNIGGFSKLFLSPTMSGNSAIDRIIDFSLKFNAVWHDVSRTKVVREAYRSLLEAKIKDFRFAEQFICFYVAAYGNIYRGEELYMLHQSHPDTAAVIITSDTHLEWANKNEWDLELDKFLSALAKIISIVDNIDINQALQIITRTYLVNIHSKKLINAATKSTQENSSFYLSAKKMFSKIKSSFSAARKVMQLIRKLFPVSSNLNSLENVPTHYKIRVLEIEKFLKDNCTES